MALHVLEPGLCTLVADRGRPGWRRFGVPVGGAADRLALAVGNGLVGNAPDAAALEVTLAGPTVRADTEVACVVYGAPFVLNTDRRPLRPGVTFTLEPGETMAIGTTATRLRAYLCVRGGLDTPVVLGSRSSLAPLAAGTAVPCAAGRIHGRLVHGPFGWEREPGVLRAIDGAQADWFRADDFYGREFQVGEASNRMGLRLRGEPLARPDRELVSEPVSPGTVQVTSDGQCIVLGVDAQTIGGYPKVAQVIAADLHRLGQLRPGDGVRFVRVTLAEAEDAYRRLRAEWREWLLRLRVSLAGWPAASASPLSHPGLAIQRTETNAPREEHAS